MFFIKRDKITKKIIGTHSGKAMPILSDSHAHEFVEVSAEVRNDVSEKMSKSANEHRALVYDGSVILGNAPPNVVKIDLDGDSILKSGEVATLIFDLLGGGSVVINLGDKVIPLNNTNKKVSITITAT